MHDKVETIGNAGHDTKETANIVRHNMYIFKGKNSCPKNSYGRQTWQIARHSCCKCCQLDGTGCQNILVSKLIVAGNGKYTEFKFSVSVKFQAGNQ